MSYQDNQFGAAGDPLKNKGNDSAGSNPPADSETYVYDGKTYQIITSEQGNSEWNSYGSGYSANPAGTPPPEERRTAYGYYTYGESPANSPEAGTNFGWGASAFEARTGVKPRTTARNFRIPTTSSDPKWTKIFLYVILAAFIGQIATGGNPLGATPYGDLMEWGAAVEIFVRQGEWWRLVTPIFLHFGLLHIMFNSLALYALGSQLESLMGSRRLILIFFLTGIAGNILTLLVEDRNVIAAGASGAVFGIMGALISLFYRDRVRLGEWGRANLRSLLLTAGLNFLFTISIPGVGVWAHAGGFIMGLFLGYCLSPWHIEDDGNSKKFSLARFGKEWYSVPVAIVALVVLFYLAMQGVSIGHSL